MAKLITFRDKVVLEEIESAEDLDERAAKSNSESGLHDSKAGSL